MKKFKNTIKVAITTGIAVILSSCSDDFINLSPPTSITPEVAFSNEAGFQGTLLGAYQSLRAADYFGRTTPVLGDLWADNVFIAAQNSGRYTDYNNLSFVVNNGNALGLWTNAYTSILRANNIINSNTLAETENVKQIKGEAYAIRALSYFTLVRFYAKPFTDTPNGPGVPIVLEYNPNATPPRSTVSEVYQLINSDLNTAYGLVNKFTNSSQFSKYAIKGLQAKVYLAQGDYTNAKAAALDVINNGGFTLLGVSNYKAFWENPAIRTDKLETLFEVSSDAVGNAGFDALSYFYSRNGNYGDAVASRELYDLYNDSDIRKTLLFPAIRSGQNVVYSDKFSAIVGDRSDTKVVRLSELYLIAAEASFAGNETEARTYLNTLLKNRGESETILNGSSLFEKIITERRKELAFEGERYFDLQRLKRDVVRSTDYPSSARSLEYSNFRRVLPIPEQEINANPSLAGQQNPGYN